MLSKKVPLLESKITNLELVNSNWKQVDSLRFNQVSMYKSELESKEKDLKNLQKSLKRSNWITGGSILSTVILALICVLK